MFYSYELLCLKNKGKFCIPWILATTRKTLTKREIVQVDVRKSCQEVIAMITTNDQRRNKRFSLYLSAVLMHGLCLIHQRQVDIFYDNLVAAQLSMAAVGLDENGKLHPLTKKTAKRTRPATDKDKSKAKRPKKDKNLPSQIIDEQSSFEGEVEAMPVGPTPVGPDTHLLIEDVRMPPPSPSSEEVGFGEVGIHFEEVLLSGGDPFQEYVVETQSAMVTEQHDPLLPDGEHQEVVLTDRSSMVQGDLDSLSVKVEGILGSGISAEDLVIDVPMPIDPVTESLRGPATDKPKSPLPQVDTAIPVEVMTPAIEPLATAIEPMATGIKPIATTIEPVATAIEPMATAIEQLVTAIEPMTPSIEPVATAIEPLTTAIELMTTAIEPLATAIEPMATAIEPVTTAIEPAVPELSITTCEPVPAIEPTLTTIEQTAPAIEPIVSSIELTAPATEPTFPAIEPAPTSIEPTATVIEPRVPDVQLAAPVTPTPRISPTLQDNEDASPNQRRRQGRRKIFYDDNISNPVTIQTTTRVQSWEADMADMWHHSERIHLDQLIRLPSIPTLNRDLELAFERFTVAPRPYDLTRHSTRSRGEESIGSEPSELLDRMSEIPAAAEPAPVSPPRSNVQEDQPEQQDICIPSSSPQLLIYDAPVVEHDDSLDSGIIQELIDGHEQAVCETVQGQDIQEPIDEQRQAILETVDGQDIQEPIDEQQQAILETVQGQDIQEPIDEQRQAILETVQGQDIQEPIDEQQQAIHETVDGQVQGQDIPEPIDEQRQAICETVERHSPAIEELLDAQGQDIQEPIVEQRETIQEPMEIQPPPAIQEDHQIETELLVETDILGISAVSIDDHSQHLSPSLPQDLPTSETMLAELNLLLEGNEFIFFSDLCPPGKCTRMVAALTFLFLQEFHRDRVCKLTQENPQEFGPIKIEFIE